MLHSLKTLHLLLLELGTGGERLTVKKEDETATVFEYSFCYQYFGFESLILTLPSSLKRSVYLAEQTQKLIISRVDVLLGV